MKKILLYGEIGWEVTSREVVGWLEENRGEQIEMHVNSPGGDVFEAIAIRSAVKACPDLTIVVDSLAASAAAIISLCGKPLFMAEYSRLMIHSASTFASGNSKEMEEKLENLKSIDADLAGMIAEKMGRDAEDVLAEYFDGKDHWLTSDECLSMGIAEAYSTEHASDRLVSVYDCINGRRKEIKANTNTLKQDSMNLEKFQAMKAFKDCSTEEEVVTKAEEQAKGIEELQRQIGEKDERIAELEAKVSEFETEKAKAQEEADEAKITDAIKCGKLSEEQADTYRSLMKSDRENTIRLIDSLKEPEKKPDVRDYMKGEGGLQKKSYFEEEMAKIARKNSN